MKIQCSTESTAKGTRELIEILKFHYEKNPKAQVDVTTESFADRHNIRVRWMEER